MAFRIGFIFKFNEVNFLDIKVKKDKIVHVITDSRFSDASNSFMYFHPITP